MPLLFFDVLDIQCDHAISKLAPGVFQEYVDGYEPIALPPPSVCLFKEPDLVIFGP
jgi:hypothetical protein